MRISSRHLCKVFKRTKDWGSWKLGGKQRKLKQAHNVAVKEIMDEIKGEPNESKQHT